MLYNSYVISLMFPLSYIFFFVFQDKHGSMWFTQNKQKNGSPKRSMFQQHKHSGKIWWCKLCGDAWTPTSRSKTPSHMFLSLPYQKTLLRNQNLPKRKPYKNILPDTAVSLSGAVFLLLPFYICTYANKKSSWWHVILTFFFFKILGYRV